MLYVIHGNNRKKARKKTTKLVEALQEKKPDAALFRLDDESFTNALLEEYTGGQGLFEQKFIVLLNEVFLNDEARKEVLDRLEDIATSENIFILFEEDLSKPDIKKLKKHAEKVEEHSLKTKSKKKSDEFNIFSLTDALGHRDRQKMWVRYRQALESGKAPEEIHGILFWQTKTMLLVQKNDTKGLKPFVISKAKKFTANYSERELEELSQKLVTIYHDARRGGPELDITLERLALSL